MKKCVIAFLVLILLCSGVFMLGCGKQQASEKRVVLCTMFPMYQLTRNVVKDTPGVEVELMLASQLGCPHDYALTPQDMQKLAKAHILVVNGLGMEEFLGAPVKEANDKLTIIDSSIGLETLEYTDEGGHPFEWAGAFKLEPGEYTWSFAKVDGEYADPAMKMVFLAAAGDDPIEAVEEEAEELFESEAGSLAAGGTLNAGKIKAVQFDAGKDVTVFKIKIEKKGTYVFFTEHMPYEFEADEHFFKTAKGADVEPIAEEPEGDHDHGHHGHGDDDDHDHDDHDGHDHDDHGHDDHGHHDHHHHHGGPNPHLFASPRAAAQIVMNIAAELSKADPDNAKAYFANAKEYAAKLNKLADDMSALGKKLKNNRIVQPHGIFDYLARDMGLEIIAVMQAHGQEPSAAEMVDLVNTIKEKKAGAIFYEPQYPDKVGKTLSKETGVPAAELDPGASGPENAPADYYETVMRNNMKILEENLGIK